MSNQVAISSDQFLSVPYSTELAIESLKNAIALHNKTGIEIGLWVIALKEKEEHGNFTRAIEVCGLNYRTAHRYAQRAAFVLQHEDIYGAKSLRDLNGSQLDKLLKLPATVSAELYDENGQIAGLDQEEIKGLTAKQFELVLGERTQQLESIEDEVRHLEGQLGKSDMEKTKLLSKIENLEQDKLRLQAHPELVEHCSILATHWTNTAIDAINRIAPLIESLDGEQVLSQAEKDIAVSSIVYNLRYVHSRAEQMLSEITEQSSHHIRDQIGEEIRLEPSVIKRIETMRNDMMVRHDAQQNIKDNEVADKVGKRGRRKKV